MLQAEVTENLIQSLILQFTELKRYLFCSFLGLFCKIEGIYFLNVGNQEFHIRYSLETLYLSNLQNVTVHLKN